MWTDYFLFLLKALTLIISIGLLITIIIRASKHEGGGSSKGKLSISSLNSALEGMKLRIQHDILPKKELKALLKEKKVEDKKKDKEESKANNCYFIKFKGDIHASQVTALRQEVTAILSVANAGEEVVISIESPGGAVSGYGLAASQLLRLKDAGLKITACVDQVAASGGYMMACVADKIYAAPFAIVGSIGVVSQIPNLHRFLKRFDIDVDVLTSGKHKAPMTLLGENTDEGRKKHLSDLSAIHKRFKSLVHLHREQLNIDEVSEGDFWLAEDGKALNLVDEIKTSDSYVQELCTRNSVYNVQWIPHKSLEQRIKGATGAFFSSVESYLGKRQLP